MRPTRKSLADTLREIREGAPERSRRFYDGVASREPLQEAARRALGVGDPMPEFVLPSASGKLVSSDELIADGPLALSFYRGAWCPYCRAELEAMQAGHAAIRNAGARLAAVTSEIGGGAASTTNDLAIDFDVLVDVDQGLALTFGLLVYLLPEEQDYYHAHGIDLAAINGTGAWFLPLPATYVIGRDGIIDAAFVSADPRERMDIEDILSAIRQAAARPAAPQSMSGSSPA